MNQPQSLRDLVDLAVRRHDTSIRQLSFKAQEHGFRLAGTTLGNIRTGAYKSAPTTETIRAIAWLAGVSEAVAFTAAGQPVPGPPFADDLPPGVDNLSPKSRKVIIEMARVLVDLEKNANASSTEDPEQPADVRDQDAEPGDPGAGQKTGERRLRAVKHPDEDENGNIPLPDNWQDLAAYSGGSTRHIERQREWDERGEESQEGHPEGGES
ncbi:hypothetical protein [Arthrobacter silvisoli]|uniref:hypothetical protein n=1 Tax=Arthrobacter silvisoli TaxID=2291022 RepID=UPI00109BABA1|nr:hypothetical protein [Arthrobacter silvisoli]